MCPPSASREHADKFLRSRKPELFHVASSGRGRPGDELKSLLRDWLGIVADANCGCAQMAIKMNTLGPDWCEGDGLSEIVKTMQAEHAKRWADGRTILPWSDLAARQLVKIACRRARASTSGRSQDGLTSTP